MKSRFLIAVSLILAIAAPTAARDLEAVKASGTIKIATEGATPPFNFFKGKELTGFDVELGNAIAEKLGVTPEWVTLSFDALLVGLGQDRYDLVVAGHGITPERQKAVDFSIPYVCSGAAIVAKPGGAQTAADLRGKVVGVQVGTTYLAAVREVPGVKEVRTFPKDTDALQNLLAGRTEVWISDKLTALDAASKNPEAKLAIGDLLYEERYGMAFKKGNDSLRNAVNDALEQVFADGTYARISEGYFKRDIRCPD
ncbi:ABC transporter substrate-binding protein [Rhodoligotrophos defluvii]|uniref:ABC transporter substrate-binding protein n=1 Tax=Rhodoligotrophos defluvii TaxID=2561934 RepID=UPI0010C9EEE9|nr:ABC transporter substrate-binding protein [Rhodoligotrophos defluvii]